MNPIAQVIDGRRSMRTLVDALASLEKVGLLKEGDHATVRTCWMQLPDGSVVATVAVIAPGEQPHSVMLPAAARFTAKNTVGRAARIRLGRAGRREHGRRGQRAAPGRLVRPRCGALPVHLPEELTKAETEVLLCVLDVLELKKECYRPLDPSSRQT